MDISLIIQNHGTAILCRSFFSRFRLVNLSHRPARVRDWISMVRLAINPIARPAGGTHRGTPGLSRKIQPRVDVRNLGNGLSAQLSLWASFHGQERRLAGVSAKQRKPECSGCLLINPNARSCLGRLGSLIGFFRFNLHIHLEFNLTSDS